MTIFVTITNRMDSPGPLAVLRVRMTRCADQLRAWRAVLHYEPCCPRATKRTLAAAAVTAAATAVLLLAAILVWRRPAAEPGAECRTRDTGQRCVFPFSYKGLEYGSCTTADNGGVAWCSTATDHRGRYMAGQWGDCEQECPLGCRTVSGPRAGQLCVFPFKWAGRVYRACTSHSNRGVLWCATNTNATNHVPQDAWGNCAATCPGCRTTRGTPCHLPFSQGNVTREECVEDADTRRLWCLAASEDNTTLVRADCRPGCATGCHTHSGASCVFPFLHNGTVHTQCAVDQQVPRLSWCATQTDEAGVMEDGMWEYCHAGCGQDQQQE